jgi:hypothetical protein
MRILERELEGVWALERFQTARDRARMGSAPGAAACCWACGAGGDGLAAGGEETGLGGVSCLVVV